MRSVGADHEKIAGRGELDRLGDVARAAAVFEEDDFDLGMDVIRRVEGLVRSRRIRPAAATDIECWLEFVKTNYAAKRP